MNGSEDGFEAYRLIPILLAFYSRSGLTPEEGFDVPPDHLSLQLLFMSHLIEAQDPDIMENFLDERILNWVPYYCEEMETTARTAFYRKTANVAEQLR